MKQPCDEIPKLPGSINITLSDEDGQDIKINFDHQSMFIDNHKAKASILDNVKCIIPIFGQQNSSANTWFLGQWMISNNYQVFDMS